jgi:hypothetical protein
MAMNANEITKFKMGTAEKMENAMNNPITIIRPLKIDHGFAVYSNEEPANTVWW